MIDISEAIRNMVANGRAGDLLEILMGMSDFNLPSSSKEPMTNEEQRQWQMALSHLQFVSQYGLDVSEVDDEGKQYFAYPKEFEQWLSLGHPGVEKQEVVNYLEEKPL